MMTYGEFRKARACPHPVREIRKRPYQQQGKTHHQVRSQCLTCGDGVSVRITSRDLLERLPLYDRELEQRWNKTLLSEWQALAAAEQAGRDRAWWDWYDAYLATPAWHKRRQAVLRRAKGMCEGCGAAPAIQVHHLNYKHVGEEFLFELVAICKACHERLHAEKHGHH